MKKPFEIFLYGLVAVVVVAIIALSIWAEISVWDECRAEHSRMYCWRVLSK